MPVCDIFCTRRHKGTVFCLLKVSKNKGTRPGAFSGMVLKQNLLFENEIIAKESVAVSVLVFLKTEFTQWQALGFKCHNFTLFAHLFKHQVQITAFVGTNIQYRIAFINGTQNKSNTADIIFGPVFFALSCNLISSIHFTGNGRFYSPANDKSRQLCPVVKMESVYGVLKI